MMSDEHSAEDARIPSVRASFENKYFTLLRLHRDNVSELELPQAKGRKVFVLALRELRTIYPIVRKVAEHCGQHLSVSQVQHVSYYCLFFGTGPNSSRMLKTSLETFDETFVGVLHNELDNVDTKNSAALAGGLDYTPFEGHQSRLGHYYRHLYQTIAYIDGQDANFPHYEYAKTVRAQLSTHEQALLLINSLTPLGRMWWKTGYLLKYRLVKNIPRDFFDKDEIEIADKFPSGYFEWEQMAAEAADPT